MSWFSINVTDLAKNALTEAQKKIDKALDIQGKEEIGNNVLKDTTTQSDITADHDESRSHGSVFQQNQLKKMEFTSKKKHQPPGTILQVKNTAANINDDFFSVLDNEPVDTKPRKKNPKVPNTQKGFPRVENQASKTAEGIDSSNEIETPSHTEGMYTEVSLVVVADSCIADANPEKASFETQDVAAYDLKDLTTEISDDGANNTDTLTLEEHFLNLAVSQDEKIASGSTDGAELDAPNPAISTVIKEPHVEGIASPLSTAASSEIDILDRESSVSEVSSRCYEGLQISSPMYLAQTDGMDSDASQALIDSATSSPRATVDLSKMITPEVLKEGIGKSTESQCHSFQTAQQSDSVNLSHQADVEEPPSSPVVESATSIQRNEISFEQSGEKVMELSEKTEVYEQQLLNLSRRNAQLSEENDNLRTEIDHLKGDLENKTCKEKEEVTNCLKKHENMNQVLKEEKANLMKQITVLKSQLASRMTNEQVQNAISEKEESIKGLMEEGEVLAKKHLQQSNLIKKLKGQLQEKENELKSLREKASKYEAENSKLKDELKAAKGQGQEERETSLRISDAYEQRERETQILQEKLSQADEKQRTLQVNLDAAYKEIGELHKQTAEQESRILAEWKEKESEATRESALEKKKILSEQEHQKQLLMLQIMELNNSVSRAEASASRKEDDHRKEIKELQQRLQESDGRNQDLSDNVSSATRPLLRQIENLQATHSTQQRSWNALEKNLNSRIGEAQAELIAARESERIAQSMAIEAKSRAAAFEKHIESDKNVIAEKENEVMLLRTQTRECEAQVKSITEELENLKIAHKEIIHKSRKERLSLENQLQMEKVRSEAERKKYIAQQEAFQKEKDRLVWSRSEMTSVSSNQILETESVGSSNDAFHSTEGLEKQLSFSSMPGFASQLSFDTGRGMSVSNVLENLQTQLKLREGEIAQLRGEINMLEKTRSSMAEEIVRLTNLNEDLEGVAKDLQGMKEKLVQVEGRYTAILTMYGEKQEENEELKMDLADVKAMYRQQINDLLKGETAS